MSQNSTNPQNKSKNKIFAVIAIILVFGAILIVSSTPKSNLSSSNFSSSSASSSQSIYVSSSQKSASLSQSSSQSLFVALSSIKEDNCKLTFLEQLKAKYGNPKYYKYIFDEVDGGNLTIIRNISMSDTENGYFSWDAKNDLENLMSEFVDIGQVFFESPKIKTIKLRYETELKDSFGKKSTGFYMDMQMIAETFKEFEWKNLNRSKTVYQKIREMSKNDAVSQSIAMLQTARAKIDESEVIFRYNFKDLSQTEIDNLKFKCK